MSIARSTTDPGVVLEPGVRIPLRICDLAIFRRWARSAEFPERGRIDFVQGDVEVDMSPEDLDSHATPKGSMYATLFAEVERRDLGMLWVDRTRLSNAQAGLSCEPDIVLVQWETLEAGRARLVPRTGGRTGRFCEVEGTADLVVEVVSDSSVEKDRKRLRARYHAAGVREYWIVDARGPGVILTVLHQAREGFVAAAVDAEGFAASRVLGRSVRLVRAPARLSLSRYRLELRAPRSRAGAGGRSRRARS